MVQVAGILLGASEGRLDEPRSKAAASFCIAAGADDSLIPLVFTPGRSCGGVQAWPSVCLPVD
jgi:hypothetical protein